MITLINAISFSRILLSIILFILLSLTDMYLLVILIFVLAGLTDYLDGYLARKYDATSQLGEVVDPIADKILIVFVFFGIALALNSIFVGFIASLIISREIWVGGLRDLNARNNNTNLTKVTFLAKVKTSMQFLSITIYLFALYLNNMLLVVIGDLSLLITVLITLYTGFIYTYNTFQK